MTSVSRGFLRPTTTPTPDEVFDVWLSKLSGAELKVLLYVVRRTFGFKKDSDAISLNQICSGITTRNGRALDHGTGLARNTAARAVKRLEALGLLVVKRGQDARGGHEANTYRLRFRGEDDPVPSENGAERGPGDGGGSKSEPGVVTKSNQGGSKTSPPLGRKSHPQQTGGQQTGGQQTASRPPSTGPTAPPPEAAPAPQEPAPGGASPTAGAGGGETSPEQSEAQPVSEGTPALDASAVAVERLVAFGVWRRRAARLVEQLGLTLEVVSHACAVLEAEARKGTSFANPAAVLASRLEQGWVPEEKPEGPDITAIDEDWEPPPEPELKPLPEVVDAQGRSHDTHAWFREVQSELRLQLPRETFDTWLRDAEIDGYRPPDGDSPGALVIRLPNITAREWVEQRLHRVIGRLVNRWLGDAFEIAYTGPQARSGLDPPAGLVGQAVAQAV